MALNATTTSAYAPSTTSYPGTSSSSTPTSTKDLYPGLFETTNWGAGGEIPGLFLQIMYSIIAVAGIIGNFLVVFSVARVPSMRNLTSLFLVSLAVADFITSVVLIPLHLGKTCFYLGGMASKSNCRETGGSSRFNQVLRCLTWYGRSNSSRSCSPAYLVRYRKSSRHVT